MQAYTTPVAVGIEHANYSIRTKIYDSQVPEIVEHKSRSRAVKLGQVRHGDY